LDATFRPLKAVLLDWSTVRYGIAGAITALVYLGLPVVLNGEADVPIQIAIPLAYVTAVIAIQSAAPFRLPPCLRVRADAACADRPLRDDRRRPVSGYRDRDGAPAQIARSLEPRDLRRRGPDDLLGTADPHLPCDRRA
jgi:hypothetical protein